MEFTVIVKTIIRPVTIINTDYAVLLKNPHMENGENGLDVKEIVDLKWLSKLELENVINKDQTVRKSMEHSSWKTKNLVQYHA